MNALAATALLAAEAETGGEGGGGGLTTEATIAIVGVVLLAVVGLLVFIGVVRDRTPTTAIPANLKPYVDDEELETSVLERTLTAGVYLVFLTAILIGFYFFTEPTRTADAFEVFTERQIERGAIAFGPSEDETGHQIPGSFNCQSCHGAGGTGGSATYTITDPETGESRLVNWAAPSVDDVLLRMNEEQVRTTLIYGRPNTPMAAWGLAGGGPMNEAQIENVIAYLQSIQVPPEDAAEKYTDLADNRFELYKEDPELAGTPDDDLMGRALFDTNCARCHTPAFSYTSPDKQAQLPSGTGAFGPSLSNVSQQFPDTPQPILVARSEETDDGDEVFLDEAGEEVPTAQEAQLVAKTFPLTATAVSDDGTEIVTLVRDDSYFPLEVQRYVPEPAGGGLPPRWWEEIDDDGQPVWFDDEGAPTYPAAEDTANQEELTFEVTSGDSAGVYSVEVDGTNYVYVRASEELAFGPDGELVEDPVESDPLIEFHEVTGGALAQIGYVSEGGVWQKGYGQRGVTEGTMPGFGKFLTQDQIRLIVDYERSLDVSASSSSTPSAPEG